MEIVNRSKQTKFVEIIGIQIINQKANKPGLSNTLTQLINK